MTRTARLREERVLAVLLVVLVAYIGGAALGAAAPGVWRWSMAVVAAAVAAIAAFWFVAPARLLRTTVD